MAKTGKRFGPKKILQDKEKINKYVESGRLPENETFGFFDRDGEMSILNIDQKIFKKKLAESIPNLDIEWPGLSEKESKEVCQLLIHFEDLFDVRSKNYGSAIGIKHSINTGDKQLANQPPRRVSPTERQTIKE